MMTEMKDKKTSAGSGGPIGTEYQQNIQVIQKGLPKTPKKIHKCATMARRRPVTVTLSASVALATVALARKLGNKDEIEEGEEEKEDNAKRIKTVMSNYVEKKHKKGGCILF